MKRFVKLTPAELEIMEAVWKLGGNPSVRDVLEHAFPNGEKAYTTVQTIMNTLMKKGILKRKKTGLVNFYTPLCTRHQLKRTETAHLLRRFFDGSIPALTGCLLESTDVDLESIRRIRRILDEKEKKLKEDRHDGASE